MIRHGSCTELHNRNRLVFLFLLVLSSKLNPMNSFTTNLLLQQKFVRNEMSHTHIHTFHYHQNTNRRRRRFIQHIGGGGGDTTESCGLYATSSMQSLEELQNDIAELREVAVHRLEALVEQMEDLKQMNEMAERHQQQHPQLNTDDNKNHAGKDSVSSVSSTVDTTRTQKETKVSLPPFEIPPLATTVTNAPVAVAEAATTIPTPLDLLDDTSWKIVYNIGREKGTWMPKDWAVSGDRLLFQCTVKFTNEPLHQQQMHDEFFRGSTDTKQLMVQDAFIIPRGVGDSSVGRRPVPVQPMGAYKVCRNQGPCGTDIVRLYIELTDVVTVPDHTSDVYCPSGRIYATCGYFPMPSKHDPSKPSLRDKAQNEYNAALHDYEHKQFELESDNRGLLNVDHLKLMKELWDAKKKMDHMAEVLRDARQRDPEKSQLRLNMAQTVGLTREGGVCCKVHKGLALEYHILGHIEVGCIDDHRHSR